MGTATGRLHVQVSALMLATVIASSARPARAQTGSVAIGDIVQATVNGAASVGEVTQVAGGTADLNLGQNNVARSVPLQSLKVLQRAPTEESGEFEAGDLVRAPSVAGTMLTSRIIKTNGAWCEVSGVTGWNKCVELRSALETGSSQSPKPQVASPKEQRPDDKKADPKAKSRTPDSNSPKHPRP